jgi:hypothetical protein
MDDKCLFEGFEELSADEAMAICGGGLFTDLFTAILTPIASTGLAVFGWADSILGSIVQFTNNITNSLFGVNLI